MGILRYVVQGFGWEVGRTAAKESIDAVKEAAEEAPAPPPTKKELALAAKEARKAEIARRAKIEAELAALKKQR
jgi:uncharacterized membrane protein